MSKNFAIGLPDRGKFSDIPVIGDSADVKFGIQAHVAKRAGKHFDFRITSPSNPKIALSWAVRYLPKPGEKRLAIRQPDHESNYMSWSGKIPEGYGAGVVKLRSSGKARVISSSPDKISLETSPGERGSQKYSLVKTRGDNWLILNRTGQSKIAQSFEEEYMNAIKVAVDNPNVGKQWEAMVRKTPRISDFFDNLSRKSTASRFAKKEQWEKTIAKIRAQTGLKSKLVKDEWSAYDPDTDTIHFKNVSDIPHEARHAITYKRARKSYLKKLDEAYNIYERKSPKFPGFKNLVKELRYIVPEEGRAAIYSVKKTPGKAKFPQALGEGAAFLSDLTSL